MTLAFGATEQGKEGEMRIQAGRGKTCLSYNGFVWWIFLCNLVTAASGGF